MLVIAVAGPREGDADAIVPGEGVDIALALDISTSMDQQFTAGQSRLEATREVVREFIKSRKDDRVGLVVFQEDALALSPPSLDYRALDKMVAGLESGLLRDGTGIGVGLAQALNMLQDSTAASRIVILLTDGEHNADSISPEKAAELAVSLKIRVYTIGVVTRKDPGLNDGHRRGTPDGNCRPDRREVLRSGHAAVAPGRLRRNRVARTEPGWPVIVRELHRVGAVVRGRGDMPHRPGTCAAWDHPEEGAGVSDFGFVHGWLFIFLPFVPVALAVWWRGTRRAQAQARSISRTGSARPPYVAAILFSLAAMVALGAAAQPRWGTHESKLPRTGADLVVVLDISRSMDARDVEPSRLQAAKDTINAVMNRLGGDRVGLVIFAGEARVRFPLTTDFVAARQVVDSLQTGIVLVKGGTNAAVGLEEAVLLLSEDPDTGKVILLLSDGDNLGGDPAASALQVQQSGADLLVAGVGTAAGANVPVVDPQTGRETAKAGTDGQPIVTKLNEPFLRTLAAASGGRYLGADLSIVPGAVDGRLRALERSQVEERPTTLPVERYQVFAAVALGLLVLAALAERFARFPLRAGAAFAVLAFLLGACATESYEANEAGREAMERGDYDLAIEKFLEVQVQRSDDPQVTLNLAAAYAAAGRHAEAIPAARRALASNSTGTRARAYSSIGHHQFELQRLEESLDAFRRALLEDPADDNSRHDYEVVLRLLFPDAQPTEPPEPGEQGSGTATPPANPSAGASPGIGSQGDGSPTPASGTPTPGGTGSGSGPATPAKGGSVAELDRQLRAINQEVVRLLEAAGETPTAQEALQNPPPPRRTVGNRRQARFTHRRRRRPGLLTPARARSGSVHCGHARSFRDDQDRARPCHGCREPHRRGRFVLRVLQHHRAVRPSREALRLRCRRARAPHRTRHPFHPPHPRYLHHPHLRGIRREVGPGNGDDSEFC